MQKCDWKRVNRELVKRGSLTFFIDKDGFTFSISGCSAGLRLHPISLGYRKPIALGK